MCYVSLCQSTDPGPGLALPHVTVIPSLVHAVEVRVTEGLEVEVTALQEVQAEADQSRELLNEEQLLLAVQIHVRTAINIFMLMYVKKMFSFVVHSIILLFIS